MFGPTVDGEGMIKERSCGWESSGVPAAMTTRNSHSRHSGAVASCETRQSIPPSKEAFSPPPIPR